MIVCNMNHSPIECQVLDRGKGDSLENQEEMSSACNAKRKIDKLREGSRGSVRLLEVADTSEWDPSPVLLVVVFEVGDEEVVIVTAVEKEFWRGISEIFVSPGPHRW